MNLPVRARLVLFVCFVLTASAWSAGDLFAGPAIPPTTGDFFTLTPCRVYDTRQILDPLHSGTDRLIPFYGLCGVPSTARAVAINLTVIGPSGDGDLTIYPANFPNPGISTIYFSHSETLANNAIFLLSTNGTGSLRVTPFVFGNGFTGLAVDVVGYFE
jgi:hypothetical protein